MTYSFRTGEFELEYIESKTNNSVLWDNHCHAQFEMIAVLEGDVNVMLEGKSYRLKKDQTLIIPPLCYHSVSLNESGAYRRVTVLFDLAAIPNVLRSEFTENGTNFAISFSPHIERLKEICQKEDPSFYTPLAQSLMIQILYDTLKATKSSAEPKTDEFLQKVIFYIDRHLHEKITLDDLAKHTSRSKSSLCHLFEEKMNISPKQYILQKKLALASKLIGEGTPPTLAAMQVGYENYSNFYRLYVKNFGKSPTKN
ncbi:MAG: helix-turn-helix transcriptional regulator [Clostridia bacterium]|nr:helix-turn-helix transcriptional regulator [Clostridia bacterium]